jgi:hypothetical protein
MLAAPSFMNKKIFSTILADGVHAPQPIEITAENVFRFAKVDKLSDVKCRSCGVSIRRFGVRRVLCCPKCGAKNEME